MKFLSLAVALAAVPTLAVAQSPSRYAAAPASPTRALGVAVGPGQIITFSEFPVLTLITNQYSDRGIIFGGDSPFITSAETGLVLVGSPEFYGAIEGSFVDPADGVTPTVVQSFTLDVDGLDRPASVRLEWFDMNGNKLGQRTNSQFGEGHFVENFVVEGGGITRWRTSTLADWPDDYAVDNISITPAQASILFRERGDETKEGTWGRKDEIPGFDHAAFHLGNLVYESHPGNGTGIYLSEDGLETASVVDINGVQAQHTKSTFKHDSMIPGPQNSPVIDFEEIPIDPALAQSMREAIETQISAAAHFQSIDISSWESIRTTLSPPAQKGGDGDFTCVGLVEWSAEQAGHNGGEGFIRNSFESFSYPDLTVFPPQMRVAPLLSPQLLNYAMKSAITLKAAQQWFQGIFDPVDFVVTDPLGRRLGFIETLGELNEIPKAFFSGDGELEQFLIPNPVAGVYGIALVGLGSPVVGAMASRFQEKGINRVLAVGQTEAISFEVAPVTGRPGDVNLDGSIDEQDANELSALLNTVTNDSNHAGDINGDGLFSDADLALLEELIALVPVPGFYTVTPCRLADTRDTPGPWGGPALAASIPRTFTIGAQCGIPASAKAVSFNFTVTEPAPGGHLTMYPAGSNRPLASTMNFGPGQTRSNNAIVAVGPGGSITVVSGQPSGTTHLIIDVTGYFE